MDALERRLDAWPSLNGVAVRDDFSKVVEENDGQQVIQMELIQDVADGLFDAHDLFAAHRARAVNHQREVERLWLDDGALATGADLAAQVRTRPFRRRRHTRLRGDVAE